MPTLLRMKGYRFFVFSNEGNEPAHIHVTKDGNVAKFWLGPVCLASSRGFRSREMREIREMCELYEQ